MNVDLTGARTPTLRRKAGIAHIAGDTPALDDTHSSAPAPRSRLLSAGEKAFRSGTYVRELLSPSAEQRSGGGATRRVRQIVSDSHTAEQRSAEMHTAPTNLQTATAAR